MFAPVYLFLLPNVDFQKTTALRMKLKQVDWLGILFFDGAMACLIMAINFGGSLFGWKSNSEIALWVVTGVLIIGFGLTQAFMPFVASENKLYPTHFFKRPVLLNLQFQLFLASGILFVSRTSTMYIFKAYVSLRSRGLLIIFRYCSNLQRYDHREELQQGN